jgi:hypothetical protein
MNSPPPVFVSNYGQPIDMYTYNLYERRVEGMGFIT